MKCVDGMRAVSVSVLMPVYNSARYLDEAISSVLRQSHDDFELVILDDGSNDGSSEIIRRRAESDSRIRAEFQENRGISPALRRLVDMAAHPLLARMDSDDVAHPDRLQRQVAFMESHPDCVAVGSRALFIDPDGDVLYPYIDWFTHEAVDEQLMRPMIGILHPTVMMRRQAVVDVGNYRDDFRHVEDLDLFLRLAEAGRVANVPEILLRYRLHAKSVSHSHTLEQHLNGLRAVQAACARRSVVFERQAELLHPRVRFEEEDELHQKWAWMALGHGHRRVARKHAVKAIVRNPLRRMNWVALGCAVRGH